MSNDPNDMMLELFRSEVESHSEMLTSSLLALEQEASASTLERMMRAAHSIKGAARIVQVPPAVEVAHVMEDCFVAAQKGTLVITPDDVDVLLKGVDLLGQISAASRDPATDWSRFQQPVQGLVVELKGVLSGQPHPVAAAAPTPPAIPVVSPVVPPVVAPAPPAAVVPPAAPAAPPPARAHVVPLSQPPVAAVPTAPPSPPPAPPPTRLVATGPFLEAQSAETLRHQLLANLNSGAVRLELDLGQVQDLDAVGLGFLAAARAHSQQQGAELVFHPVSAPLATVLRLTGLATGPGEGAR
jgi:two-component system sensor histidine kinase and response regulator WspE